MGGSRRRHAAGDRMRAVVYLAARELRARWRGWTLLVLRVAAAGGAVLAAAAGASRTQSAYPRFLTASKASDVLVAPYFSGPPGYFGALTRLAGVREVAPFVILDLQPLGHGSWAARVTSTVAPVDGRQRLDVPKVLAGRLPAADRSDEIAVDHRAAATMGLRVGSVLTMRAVPNDPHPGEAESGQRPARPGCCASGWSASWSPVERSCPSMSWTKCRSFWPARRCFTGSACGTWARSGRTSSCGREPRRRRSGAGRSH
ncbi:MAG: hypothetical protein ACTHPS_09605 [Streptosporangiaceae bacterium]